MGRSSICFRSITLPIADEVVSIRGAAAAVTSTVSAKAPTVRVAVTSVVFVACTMTVSKTCDLKPSLETLRRYVPSERLTNVYVPAAWVSAVLAVLVAKSRNSRCAPGTTLPLGSNTVTVTVPSEPCWAQAQGRARNRTAKRHEANVIRREDTRDIRLPPANEVQHTKQAVIFAITIATSSEVQQQWREPIPQRKHYGKRFLMVGFCILYSELLSSYFLSKLVRFLGR